MINVCPGVYEEQLRIVEKSVTIRGIQSGENRKVLIRPVGDLVPVYQNQFAIILVSNSIDTRLQNLTIDGSALNYVQLNGRILNAVRYSNSWGSVERNSIQNTFNNTTDVDPNTSGVQPPVLAGPLNAALLYLNGVSDAVVNSIPADNRFFGFRKRD